MAVDRAEVISLLREHLAPLEREVASLRQRLARLEGEASLSAAAVGWPAFGEDFSEAVARFEAAVEGSKQAAHLLVELHELAELHRRRGNLASEDLEKWEQLFVQLCARHGVEQIWPVHGDGYQLSLHLVVRTVAGGVRDTVERALTRGFRWNEKVLKKSEVVLHQG